MGRRFIQVMKASHSRLVPPVQETQVLGVFTQSG